MITLFAALTAVPVSLHGMDDLRIGMPLSQLRQLGARQEHDESEEGVDCSYWTLPRRKGLALMVSSQRVVRIDIDSPAYRTLSGAHVGMSETEVRRIYRRALKVKAHPYTGPKGHYLVYRAQDEPFAMILATDYQTGKIDSFRVGLWTHVQLIEGCS